MSRSFVNLSPRYRLQLAVESNISEKSIISIACRCRQWIYNFLNADVFLWKSTGVVHLSWVHFCIARWRLLEPPLNRMKSDVYLGIFLYSRCNYWGLLLLYHNLSLDVRLVPVTMRLPLMSSVMWQIYLI